MEQIQNECPIRLHVKKKCFKNLVFSKIWSLTLHFRVVIEMKSLMLKEYICEVSEIFVYL